MNFEMNEEKDEELYQEIEKQLMERSLMKTPKHTPGPWSVVETTRTLTNSTTSETVEIPEYHIKSAKRPVAQVHLGGSAQDAALIAAAPDLYSILDKINSAFYSRTTRKQWLDLMEQTKPLLKKARGES